MQPSVYSILLLSERKIPLNVPGIAVVSQKIYIIWRVKEKFGVSAAIATSHVRIL